MNPDGDEPGCSEHKVQSIIANSLNVSEESVDDDDKLFGCGRCLKYFKDAASAKKCFCSHKIICFACSNTGKKSFHCKVCNTVLRNAAKKRSIRSTSSKTLSIEISNPIFVLMSQATFPCKECHFSFSRSDHLENHMKIHMYKPSQSKVHDSTSVRDSARESYTLKPDGQPSFQCQACGTSFSKSIHLRIHTRIRHGRLTEMCDSALRNEAEKSIVLSKQNKLPFQCKVCHASFNKHDLFKRHIDNHIAERQFTCDVCDSIERGGLQAHMRAHTHERQFLCDVCGRAFREGSALRLHMYTHTGE